MVRPSRAISIARNAKTQEATASRIEDGVIHFVSSLFSLIHFASSLFSLVHFACKVMGKVKKVNK